MEKIRMLLLGIALGILLMSTTVIAKEVQYQTGILLETTADASIYETTDEKATKLVTLEAGTPILCQEDIDANWVKVQYQEYEGYALKSAVKQYENADTNQEFEEKENNITFFYAEQEKLRRSKVEKIVWGIVIACLVVAIFVVGIVGNVLRKMPEPKKVKCSKNKWVDKTK